MILERGEKKKKVNIRAEECKQTKRRGGEGEKVMYEDMQGGRFYQI